MEAVPAVNPTRKFYVFDRDDTLIDGQAQPQLINPDFVIPFLQAIDREESFQWAIASAGAIEWDADPVKALIGDDVQKRPFYTQLAKSWASLGNLVCNVSGVEPRWTQKDRAYLNEQPGRAEKVSFDIAQAQTIFTMLSEQAELEQFKDINVRWLEASFAFKSHITFELKLGNTCLIIHAETFFKNRELIQRGDNKLFCILLALDQAKLCVDDETKAKLARLGLTKIHPGHGYQTIAAKDVVFVDDKSGNCDLVTAAGFTAIQADTQPAFDAGRCVTTNTYMETLHNTLPQDVVFKNFVAEISALTLKNTPSEIILEKREVALEQIKALFDSGNLNALEALPQLAPLFSYKEFRFFSKSIDPIARTNGLITLADRYIEKNQYHKELSDFLVLTFSHNWKNKISSDFAKEVAKIKPEGQENISTTHFRLMYQAQYRTEFFCNPFSSIHRQIEANPEDFDKQDMATVKGGIKENSRSARLLGTLGAR